MAVELALIARQLLHTVLALPSVDTAEEVDRTAARLLHAVVPCDQVLRTHVDLTSQSATVQRGEELAVDPVMSSALGRFAGGHPAVTSYLVPGDDGRPRRVSDVVTEREWVGTTAYDQVFREDHARFQLSLVVQLSSTHGTGWVLTRSSSDFTDDDVAAAAVLLPQATALDALACRLRARGTEYRPGVVEGPPVAPHGKQVKTPVDATRLTPREIAVIQEVSTGATAQAVGRTLGISVGTVRKHLENAYAKLGVHDRVSAMNAMNAMNRPR